MEFIKRVFVGFLILTTVGLFSRGWAYRHLITYKSIGLRGNYSATDKRLVNYINTCSGKQTDSDIGKIIDFSLSITSRQLKFTVTKNAVDPNKLIHSRMAHCVGYASFFATTCNYILQKHNLDNLWVAKPRIGQLYFGDTNIHTFFKSAFFKDHDFVTIENKATGEIFAVDPTVHDYLWIGLVTYAK